MELNWFSRTVMVIFSFLSICPVPKGPFSSAAYAEEKLPFEVPAQTGGVGADWPAGLYDPREGVDFGEPILLQASYQGRHGLLLIQTDPEKMTFRVSGIISGQGKIEFDSGSYGEPDTFLLRSEGNAAGIRSERKALRVARNQPRINVMIITPKQSPSGRSDYYMELGTDFESGHGRVIEIGPRAIRLFLDSWEVSKSCEHQLLNFGLTNGA